MDWIKEASKTVSAQNEIMSYDEYINYFKEHTALQCRPSFLYLLDMLDYFGISNRGNFKLFLMEHHDSPPVYGQYKPQKAIFHNLKNFEEEGFNNKFILLVGPNGSAKTSLVRKIIKGAEDYSRTSQGALYTFSWVFPIDNYIKGTLGLNAKPSEHNLLSYAHLEDKDISAILPSELKDHPLLLIPLEYRREILDEALKGHPKQLESIKKSYLYQGDLSKRNRMIYDALLKNYKGDHAEVLKHIRIERFTISRRYSTSAVTIEPQLHVDAQMQQITMDKRLGSLPPSLQSLNLFSMQGEVVLANRGILEYSDLLKRPLDAYKYLLMTMETGSINISGILTALDIFFIGTSNEIHLNAFKQHPDYNSFKGRINFIRVPYLLDYKSETKIYREQVAALQDKATFEPHSISILSLFAIMTRLRAPQAHGFQDKALAEIATTLDPLEKTLFLSEDRVLPERLDSDAKKVLRQGVDEILEEFENENLYEGKFGISPRDIKKIIFHLSELHRNVTFMEVIDYLEKLIQQKNEFDFLNMSPHGDYHHPARFVSLLKEYGLSIFDSELRNSLGLIDNRSYEDYIKRYIENVNALLKGEKIKNSATGRFEDADDFFIKEFEKSIDLKEDAKNFRYNLISQLGAYALDNAGKTIVYSEVFPELIKRLQESFRNEQKKVIQNIAQNLVFFEAELEKKDQGKKMTGSTLSDKNREQIVVTLKNLTTQYHYTQSGAMNLMKFLIKELY